MKTLEIDSQNHFQLIQVGDEVEVVQYGSRCPQMNGGEFEGKTVLAKLHPQTDILWRWMERDWDGDEDAELVDVSRVVPLDHLSFILEEIVCGDDFIRELRHALPKLTYVVFPCTDVVGDWVGHCIEFDAVSQGQTAQEALNMVMEAARIIWDEDRKEGRDPFKRGCTITFSTSRFKLECRKLAKG
jgi:predicted RNase H-like HicB family nuclease